MESSADAEASETASADEPPSASPGAPEPGPGRGLTPPSACASAADTAVNAITVTAAPAVTGRVDVAHLRDRLAAAAAVLGHPLERLAVRLVDDAEMSRLHRQHSGVDGATDVLTFPSSAPAEAVDADIACGVDVAARQSAGRPHDTADELLLYALHGLLHCVGHDDHDSEAYARMHAEEDRILAAIGATARFASPGENA